MPELREISDEQPRAEPDEGAGRPAAFGTHVTEREEGVCTAREDLIVSEEVNTKLQRDVCEVSNITCVSVGTRHNRRQIW